MGNLLYEKGSITTPRGKRLIVRSHALPQMEGASIAEVRTEALHFGELADRDVYIDSIASASMRMEVPVLTQGSTNTMLLASRKAMNFFKRRSHTYFFLGKNTGFTTAPHIHHVSDKINWESFMMSSLVGAIHPQQIADAQEAEAERVLVAHTHDLQETGWRPTDRVVYTEGIESGS